VNILHVTERARQLPSLSSSSSSSSKPSSSLKNKNYVVLPKKNRSLLGRNGHRWSSVAPKKKTSCTPRRNIIHQIQSPVNEAKKRLYTTAGIFIILQ